MGENKILPSMRAELTRDFKEGTRIRELYPDMDDSGALIQLQFAGREALGKNYYIKRKNMDSYLFWYLQSGTKSYIHDDIVYNTTAGCFAVEDCMKETVGWVTPSPIAENTVQYYIHFYPTPLVRSVAEYMLKYAPRLQFDNDELGFVDMVTSVLDDLDAGTYDERKWSERYYKFFLDLTECIKRKRIMTELPPAVSDTLGYIAQNYTADIDLSSCARNVHLSPNYLDGIFSAYMRIGIGAYIAKYRFTKASEMLTSSEKSIAQIAADVGLNDSQALIRLFKKNIGMTPLAYKKYYKGK